MPLSKPGCAVTSSHYSTWTKPCSFLRVITGRDDTPLRLSSLCAAEASILRQAVL